MSDNVTFSSTGRLLDYGAVPSGPPGGGNSSAPLIYLPLPGEVINVVRPLYRVVTAGELPGRHGSMDVSFVAGTAGANPQAVCALVDSLTAPVGYLSVTLNTNNQVLIKIKDAAGSTVGANTPPGSALASGAPFMVHVAWNADAPIDGARYAEVVINGIKVTSWATDPTSAWSPPAIAGFTAGDTTVATTDPLAGTFGRARVSSLVVLRLFAHAVVRAVRFFSSVCTP